MTSPVVGILSALAQGDPERDESVWIKRLAVGSCLSNWIDGKTLHREAPPLAGRYSFATRRALAFRYSVVGEEVAGAMLEANDTVFGAAAQ